MLEFIYNQLSIQTVVWIVVAAPLAGGAASVLFSVLKANAKKRTFKGAFLAVGFLAPLFSLLSSIVLYFTLTAFEVGSPALITGPLFKWANTNFLVVDIGLRVDQLSMALVLAISIVGFLASLYSMGHDGASKRFGQRVGLINFFIGFALLGVLADNMILMIVAWEVAGYLLYLMFKSDGEGPDRDFGMCVYNLISFAALLAAAYLIYGIMHASEAEVSSGIFNFESMERSAPFFMSLAAILSAVILLGVAIKSAQFPFFMWAVRGASGENATLPILCMNIFLSIGVYLIIRLNFVFALSPDAMEMLRIIGIMTILSASIFCIVEADVMLAAFWLIVAQLGYVFLSCGAGSFVAATYHLMSFYVFSALLVMTCGSVVYALGGDRKLDSMGGIKYRMPVTFWTFMFAALSISAIFPLSGFFSSDAVLWQVYERGYVGFWVFGFIGTGLVSFGVFRMAGSVFFGSSEIPEAKFKRLGEAPISMVLPMMILATFCLLVGLLGIPEAIGGSEVFRYWLGDVMTDELSRAPGEGSSGGRIVLMIVTVLFSIHFSVVAWLIYAQKRDWPSKVTSKFGPLHKVIVARFYLDEVFIFAFKTAPVWISRVLVSKFIDEWLVNGFIMNIPGRVCGLASAVVSLLQAGEIQRYILYILIGAVIVTALLAL